MENTQVNLKKLDKEVNKRGQLPPKENSHMIFIIIKFNCKFKVSSLNACIQTNWSKTLPSNKQKSCQDLTVC